MNETQMDKTPTKRPLICVAAIAGAFGIKGEIKVKSFTEDPLACAAYGPLFNESGDRILTPRSARPIKGGVALRTSEVITREQAEALKSVKLYVPRDVLPELNDDEFYFDDLIGLEVKTVDGKRAGHVIAVHEFGAGDMLEIMPPKTAEKRASFFHPFTKTATPKVDIKTGRVIIIPQIDTD